MFSRILLLAIPIIAITSFFSFSSMNMSNNMAFNENSSGENLVKAEGTFIQWWLVKNWDNEKWEREMKILNEAEMTYVVLTSSAFFESAGGKEHTYTFYPTGIDGFSQAEEGGKKTDIIEMCLKNAEKNNIKVFLGLNFSEEWWANRNNKDWFYKRINEGNKIADELWKKYKSKYPLTFHGWYWGWEIDNFYFRTMLDFGNSKEMLSKGINILVSYLDENKMRLPVLISPYMDGRLGSPGDYAKMWEYVFLHSGLKKGDIFCPQDGVGARLLNEGNYIKWFKELKKAVSKVPGMEYWANIENFDIKDWTATTIDNVINKMKGLNGIADRFLVFSYTHYYSANTVNEGFHQTYLRYLHTGVLEPIPPAPPANLKLIKGPANLIELEWDTSIDNMGIYGYYIYRNGRIIGKTSNNYFGDHDTKEGKSYEYAVQSYDFAGNRSVLSDNANTCIEH